ncbi:hypothetical protein UPYG_G00257010 [Umbra pygmaea]|uniref:DNA-directed RNA polymerase n=1 Tax=Umbra pygmaea TaxID=75934 RepID=A0ABD0WD33_UMBPY
MEQVYRQPARASGIIVQMEAIHIGGRVNPCIALSVFLASPYELMNLTQNPINIPVKCFVFMTVLFLYIRKLLPLYQSIFTVFFPHPVPHFQFPFKSCCVINTSGAGWLNIDQMLPPSKCC